MLLPLLFYNVLAKIAHEKTDTAHATLDFSKTISQDFVPRENSAVSNDSDCTTRSFLCAPGAHLAHAELWRQT